MARVSLRSNKTEWLLEHAKLNEDEQEEQGSESDVDSDPYEFEDEEAPAQEASAEEKDAEEEAAEEKEAEEEEAEEKEAEEEEDEQEQEGAFEERQWRGVSAAHDVTVQDSKALEKYTFSSDIAAEFWNTTFPAFIHDRDMHNEVTSQDTITVYEAASFKVDIFETSELETRQLRCSPSFMGAPWQDGVVIVEQHPDPGALMKRKKGRVLTQANIEIARNPDATRMFGIINLIFEYAGSLFLLLEMLEGANITKDKRKKKRTQVQWQNAIIPNWHHLQTKTTRAGTPAALSRRLEIYPLDSVERIVAIVPDPNQPENRPVRCYWSPRNEDCVLSDMVFNDGTQYEHHGRIDPVTGFPAVAFEDAVSVQPWDLVPPSSFASDSRSRITMDNGDFNRAAQSLEDSERPYGHDDEGSDQNSEDDSDA
jgi:hypothetical protein